HRQEVDHNIEGVVSDEHEPEGQPRRYGAGESCVVLGIRPGWPGTLRCDKLLGECHVLCQPESVDDDVGSTDHQQSPRVLSDQESEWECVGQAVCDGWPPALCLLVGHPP